jgi:hypothetical protein
MEAIPELIKLGTIASLPMTIKGGNSVTVT